MKSIFTDWNKEEIKFLSKHNSPVKIQDYLDSIPYNHKKDSKSPRYVLEKGNAHCLEGAVFAAACLKNCGFSPLIVDLRAVNDDDHLIAVYKVKNCWGAIAKSNFTTLRFREPYYKSLRELCMSYFDFYFNTNGQKTLRAYSSPFNLTRYDNRKWWTTTEDLEYIGYDIDRQRHFSLIDTESAKSLNKVRHYLFEAGLLGSNPEGLYKPEK